MPRTKALCIGPKAVTRGGAGVALDPEVGAECCCGCCTDTPDTILIRFNTGDDGVIIVVERDDTGIPVGCTQQWKRDNAEYIECDDPCTDEIYIRCCDGEYTLTVVPLAPAEGEPEEYVIPLTVTCSPFAFSVIGWSPEYSTGCFSSAESYSVYGRTGPCPGCCDCVEDCEECLTISFQGDEVCGDCWDGVEVVLDMNCVDGNIFEIAGSLALFPCNNPFGLSPFSVYGTCDDGHWIIGGSFVFPGVPSCGSSSSSDGDDIINGSIDVLSCDPLHIVGSWIILTFPACEPWCEGVFGFVPWVIYWEITE